MATYAICFTHMSCVGHRVVKGLPEGSVVLRQLIASAKTNV